MGQNHLPLQCTFYKRRLICNRDHHLLKIHAKDAVEEHHKSERIAPMAIFWNMYVVRYKKRIQGSCIVIVSIMKYTSGASQFLQFSASTGPNIICQYFSRRSFMRSRTHALHLVRLLLPIQPTNVDECPCVTRANLFPACMFRVWAFSLMPCV